MTLEIQATFIPLFICTSRNYLLSGYDVPGTVQTTGQAEANKAAMGFAIGQKEEDSPVSFCL